MDGQHLSGQHGGVFGAVQRNGGHRNAAGHLHGGQQGVQAVHRAALNGDADDGQHGVRGDAARQMGGHTRGRDDHAEAVFRRALCKLRRSGRGAVGAHYAHLKRDIPAFELCGRGFYRWPVAVRAHDDGYFFGVFHKSISFVRP